MSIELRYADAGEMRQLALLGSYVFGGTFGDGDDNLVSRANRPEWTLAAFDADRLVSSLVSIPFTMRAGGQAVALSGITSVGTLPEYRRRGLVRRLITRSLAASRERGQGLAALWASQAAIYQRYGFACATRLREYRVDTADIAFADGDAGTCRVERVAPGHAYEVVKPLYIEFVANRFCYLHRGKQLWMRNVLEAPQGEGPVHVAVARDANGSAQGYVAYTLRGSRVDHPARNQAIEVRDLVWLSQDAYRSLWRFLAAHDLVGRVSWLRAPGDDPAFELFAEPRMLRSQDREGVWLRVVDVERALAERGYSSAGTLTLGIAADDLTPWNAGTYRIEVGEDGARVTRTTREPEMVTSVRAIAQLYAGTFSASRLAAWGFAEGPAAVLARADALFATAHAPHCPDHF